ncbi:MAG: hypothetical protein H6739_11050 [Alphaproteobacteria bacterium]|nr:hypothetical protein [Alphaproteobacteria bacterium]
MARKMSWPVLGALLAVSGCAEPECLYECVDETPMVGGDVDIGRDALLNEGLMTCGVPWAGFEPLAPLFDGPSLPEREGRNAELAYNLTATTTAEGVELVNVNCLNCHASVFEGELVMGLGESWIDDSQPGMMLVDFADPRVDPDTPEQAELDRLREIVTLMDQYPTDTIGENRGDTLLFAFAAHRDPVTFDWLDEPGFTPPQGAPIPHDVPPWWGMRKKNAMFANTAARGDYSRWVLNGTLMCLDDPETARDVFAVAEDVRAFIESVEPPPWPGRIDEDLAEDGQDIFEATCSRCHGTYGEDWTYPNLVVPVEEVGTDPLSAESVDAWQTAWDAQFSKTELAVGVEWAPRAGYIAPPLDGIWITAPYLHNGSVPTLEAVLDPSLRPAIWRRTGEHDRDAVGWEYEVLAEGKDSPPDGVDPVEIVDTTLPGYSNEGHPFGEPLSDDERRAVLEYLKTL